MGESNSKKEGADAVDLGGSFHFVAKASGSWRNWLLSSPREEPPELREGWRSVPGERYHQPSQDIFLSRARPSLVCNQNNSHLRHINRVQCSLVILAAGTAIEIEGDFYYVLVT